MPLILTLVLTVACSDDEDSPVNAPVGAADGIWEIDDTAASITTSSGLTLIHVEQGAGLRPSPGATVSVHYTGMFEDGTVFDSSYPRESPIRFQLGVGQVIAGWDEGIGLMQRGGKARLVIPPELGYGASGAGGGTIPPNATLIFDVWLVSIE